MVLLSSAADTSGAGYSSQATGCVFTLMRLVVAGNVWTEPDPGLEDWEAKRDELHLQLDEKVHFLPSLCLD